MDTLTLVEDPRRNRKPTAKPTVVPPGAPAEPPREAPAPPRPEPPPDDAETAPADPPFTSFCYAPNSAFERRNKAYGAYWLRRRYQRRLSIALLAGSVCFVVGVTSPIIYQHVRSRTIDEDATRSRVVQLTELEAPPLDPKQPPTDFVPPPPPPRIATVRFVAPEVAHDEDVLDEEIPASQEALKTVQAAAVTQEGDPDADPNEIIVDEPVNQVTEVIGVTREEEVTRTEVFVIVEQMPEIQGGASEIYRYLTYPDLAVKAGIEGRVVVEIVVEPDGLPGEPTVVKSAGAMLDGAAIDAVMKLRFIPGKQRGVPVRVRMSIPIRFRLDDAR